MSARSTHGTAALAIAFLSMGCGGGGASTPTSPTPAGGGGSAGAVIIAIVATSGPQSFTPNPAAVHGAVLRLTFPPPVRAANSGAT